MKYETKQCYAVWEQIQRQSSYISSAVKAKMVIAYILCSQMPSESAVTNTLAGIPLGKLQQHLVFKSPLEAH